MKTIMSSYIVLVPLLSFRNVRLRLLVVFGVCLVCCGLFGGFFFFCICLCVFLPPFQFLPELTRGIKLFCFLVQGAWRQMLECISLGHNVKSMTYL